MCSLLTGRSTPIGTIESLPCLPTTPGFAAAGVSLFTTTKFLPGASYIAALHNLIVGEYSTATQIAAVVVFAIIEFLLIIIPWALLELRPEGTAAMLRRSQDWLSTHTRQLMAWIAVLLGAYLVISALTRLL